MNDHDATIMLTFSCTPVVFLQDKAVLLREPVDAFAVRGWIAPGSRPAPNDRPDPRIAIGRNLSDHRHDLAQQRLFGQRWAPAALGRPPGNTPRDIRPSHTEQLADGRHRELCRGSDSSVSVRREPLPKIRRRRSPQFRSASSRAAVPVALWRDGHRCDGGHQRARRADRRHSGGR